MIFRVKRSESDLRHVSMIFSRNRNPSCGLGRLAMFDFNRRVTTVGNTLVPGLLITRFLILRT